MYFLSSSVQVLFLITAHHKYMDVIYLHNLKTYGYLCMKIVFPNKEAFPSFR